MSYVLCTMMMMLMSSESLFVFPQPLAGNKKVTLDLQDASVEVSNSRPNSRSGLETERGEHGRMQTGKHTVG